MLLILGGGIGGVIVHHGQMMEGAHYAAGEVSYMRGDYKERDGSYCMFAETNSIHSLAKCVEEETGTSNMNVIRIMMKIQSGDEAVIRGAMRYCDWMADYIYNVQCVVDASRVVIGGNIDDPCFIELIKKAVRNRFDSVPYHVIWEPEVVESTFHSDARMFGAVYNFRNLKTAYYD
jgi:predicted NBD/HSP70 family sugar kinase